MDFDIGQMIFVDLLKMTQYPGSPFSGEIIKDLVMFLFIPSVFSIAVIYVLVGRLTDNSKIKLLFGIAFFLFVVFGGYYPMFALLAGPYFLFLLIFMGIILFFFGHIGIRRGGGGGGMPGRALEATGVAESHARAASDLLTSINVQCGVVESALATTDQRNVHERQQDLGRLLTDFKHIKANMKFNPGERARYAALLAAYGINENIILNQADKLLHMKKK